MFDNERPQRISAAIWVAAYDDTHLTCARCCLEVFQRDIAAYTRTKPGAAFDPWCANCFSQLARWALAGAGDALADEPEADAVEIIGVIYHGK